MKSNLRSLLIPGCSFALAVVLALASGAPMRAFGLRRAQAGTLCVLSAKVNSIAATAKNWNFKVTDLKIATSNTKQAVLDGKVGLAMVANVTGTGANGAAFNFLNMGFSADFVPRFSKTYPAGNRTGQFKGMTCGVGTLNAAATATANAVLESQNNAPGTINQPVFPAQTVEIVVHGTFICIDNEQTGIANGIFLTLPLPAKGTGKGSNP
ncbi:MAG TPA: hypothetical protein VJB14_00750 [Planctomycetota bacterium]|nr:hypothetical protein [Planctomycetota bacterium]